MSLQQRQITARNSYWRWKRTGSNFMLNVMLHVKYKLFFSNTEKIFLIFYTFKGTFINYVTQEGRTFGQLTEVLHSRWVRSSCCVQ